MNLSVDGLKPNYVEISYSTDGRQTSAAIDLNLLPTRSTAVLEIGEKHVFASSEKRSINWMKWPIRDLRLRIERRSELIAEESENFGLSEVAIGRLFFLPPKKRDKLGPACPAVLQGRVFVSDEIHESLRHIFDAGKMPTCLRFSLEFEDGVLKYGWEPDGSRMVWKLETGSAKSYLVVTNMRIGVRQWGHLRSLFVLLSNALGY